MIVALMGAVMAQMAMAPMAMGQNFQLPRPPKTLTGVPQRAGWIVEHYWDNADMAALASAEDKALAGKASELEQAFVNYLALFPLTESDSLCNAAVAKMMHKADSVQACRQVFALANKYLFDLDSPMANEEHFLFFIQAAKSSNSISSIQRQETVYWTQVIDNNRVGREIEEFSFETPQGKLMDFADVKGERLLLLFDTECADCRAMIEALKQGQLMQDPVNNTPRQVVAIAVNSNRKDFRKFAESLPSEWITGWDSTGTINGGAFALRHLPDLYLVSADGIVLAKHLKAEN